MTVGHTRRREMDHSTNRGHLSIHDLPVDIFRDVLVMLEGHKPTLSSCNAVSRACSAVARPLLFSHIVVNLFPCPKFHTEFVDIASRKLTPSSLGGFIDEYPELANAVEELTYTISRVVPPNTVRMLPLNMSHVSATLPRLPRLRILNIHSLALSDGPRPPHPVRVGRLRTSRFEWKGSGDAFPLHILFKHVAADVYQHGFTSYLLPYSVSVPIPAQGIRRLEIELSHTIGLALGFLSLYVTPGSLRTLVLAVERVQDLDAMCTFLCATGQGLEDIQLDPTAMINKSEEGLGPMRIDWAPVRAALSALPHLHSFHIRVPATSANRVKNQAEFDTRHSIFPALFPPESALYPSMRRLTVCFTDQLLLYGDTAQLRGLGVLDVSAVHRPCPHLECVRVEIDVTPRIYVGVGAIQKAVEEALPDMVEAGIVQIVDVSARRAT